MAISSIRLAHTVIPASVKKLGTPARVSARSSLPFSVGDWRGVSTFSGARPLLFAKVKQRGESIEDDSVPIEDSMDDSTHQLADEQFLHFEERDFAGTPCVPVYVMLPLGVIDMNSEVVEPEELLDQLRTLKSVNVDGVMVDFWWGIVEAHTPQVYNWSGYKKLFQMIRELGLKIQVVMSFHECGGNVGYDVHIQLPEWVRQTGQSNPDIYFTDRAGRRNSECLTWGIDKQRVLRGRTALEVYFDYMRSFRVEFDEFFEDKIITEIEVGLGPCGELRYPSYPAKHGWKYPGIGEFQSYDKYLMKSLKEAAEVRGHSFWARGPDNMMRVKKKRTEPDRFECANQIQSISDLVFRLFCFSK